MSRVLKAVLNNFSASVLPLAGNVYDGDEIAFDPDQELQGAVRTVFELFQREGTAFTAVERFNELGRADRITGRRRIGQERGNAQVASQTLPMHRCAETAS